jgi:hypothetical protein
MVDGDAWHYYAANHGRRELIGTVPHGHGSLPGSTLDLDIAHGGSRWEARRHQRLIDATVAIGTIEAVLSFIRKSQNKQLLYMIGQIDGVAAGQVQDPERGLSARTQNPQGVNLGVLDIDLDPENHIKHQAWLMQTIARSYGGQIASRPGSSSILEAEVMFSHEALTEQRNAQIPFATDFMRELLAHSVEVAVRGNHPLRFQLPTTEDVLTSTVVKYPPLSRSFANVDEQIKWANHSLSRGLQSFEDLLRPAMPSATDAELTAHLMGNLQRQSPVIEMMTTRDQSVGEVPVSETESQRNGRTGPQIRDEENDDE